MASAPYKRMVVLGDSISYGMCAAAPEHEWNQVVARLLREFQDEGPVVFNRGLPAEVISPRCPGYAESAKPSLLERYREHCIDLAPDLVIIAEGLNDLRSGMPLLDYVADLETIVADIGQQTDALMVVLGLYHQGFGRGANDPAIYPTWTRWTPDIAAASDQSMRLTAERLGALFVDVRRIMAGADWLLHTDACHLNDLGHVLVGNGIFEAIATAHPSIADPTFRTIEQRGVSILDTGGTDTDDEIRSLWTAALDRFSAHVE